MNNGWKVAAISCGIAAAIFGVLLFAKVAAKPATYSNAETWRWVDYAGRQREIVVIRNAKVT